ncbi:hypothetical protein [Bergeyella cardium]|uniref:hypothetical protein n=1 Tax=Bergeyella cardium TaxID=1585976 RepID=UPI000EA255D9|nr:hypothetical protein [Bergeyella cardium]
MKKILTIILAMFCLASCKNKKNDLTEMNLKGKVKSIRETRYKAVEKFGEAVKVKGDISDSDIEELLFNEKGNIIEKNRFFYGLYWKYTYKYDEKGNKIEGNYFNKDGSLCWKYTYKYDEKGNQIEENWFNPDGSLDKKYTYKYDEKGNQVEENNFNKDGSLEDKFTYKYDEKGNQIETNWFNEDGSLERKFTYKYDEKGNLIETNWFNEDGSLERKFTYRYTYYDQKDNWTQRIEYEIENDIEKASTITERIIEYY